MTTAKKLEEIRVGERTYEKRDDGWWLVGWDNYDNEWCDVTLPQRARANHPSMLNMISKLRSHIASLEQVREAGHNLIEEAKQFIGLSSRLQSEWHERRKAYYDKVARHERVWPKEPEKK